jgi:hypothetical protein
MIKMVLYMAIKSGVNHLGLPGHVITREQGAAVIQFSFYRYSGCQKGEKFL